MAMISQIILTGSKSRHVNWSILLSAFYWAVRFCTCSHASTSLATEAEYVRGRLATYVNDLLSLGVDGLRLDAAKRK